jgi:hypothetical protein
MNSRIPLLSLKLVSLLGALCCCTPSPLVAQDAQTNLVAVTIVGFPPAEIVRLVQTPVISMRYIRKSDGIFGYLVYQSDGATISPFIIERNYSPAFPTWRQWFNVADTAQGPRNATIAFLASPGNVVNTLEFMECFPIAYSIGPDATGVLKERLTIQPSWLPE